MVSRTVPIHRLRPNEAVWTPPVVICLDTETRKIPDTEPEVNRLVLWAAEMHRRTDAHPKKPRMIARWGHTAHELVDWLTEAMVGERSIWVYAHNVAFDMVTTRLPVLLCNVGWRVTDFSVSDRAPWFRLAMGSKRLLITDSWSWLPTALATIGEAVQIAKPALPRDDAPMDDVRYRCQTDVRILSTAIIQLMDWWDKEQLGRWSITGAACGWNAMRHRTPIKRVTIVPDPDGIAFDRLAVRGGRRDVWRFGRFEAGPYAEVDFVAAHPTIAAHLPLPVKRAGQVGPVRCDDIVLRHDGWGLIAQCTVRTTKPRYPVRIDGFTWYPTGTFSTVLAGPELREALARDELVSIEGGYLHQLGTPLATWAHWVLELAANNLDGAPPVASIAGKSWSRSVLGRFAGRTHRMVRLGRAPTNDWNVTHGRDLTTGAHGTLVDMGRRRWWIVHDQEGDNSYPAVLAFVESHLRVRMARAIDTLPEASLITCDTDGIFLDPKPLRAAYLAEPDAPKGYQTDLGIVHWWCQRLSKLTWPLVLRIKRVHETVTVFGPQQIMADGHRRFAGLRHDADEVAPNTYQFRAWPKLAWQMANGSPDGYVMPLRTSVMVGPYVPRWITGVGTLAPPQATTGADGETVLVPWDDLDPRPYHDLRADVQHPALARLSAQTPTA